MLADIKKELTVKEFWGRLALGTALLMGAGQLAFTPVAGATDTTYSEDDSANPLKGGVASNNNLTISAGTFPGAETVFGGGNDGTADNNTVTITGGNFTHEHGVSIFGGYSAGYNNSSANNNTVTIKNLTGKVSSVRGGFATGEVKDNTVNLLMNNLQISNSLAGGGGNNSTVISGNTLNIAAKNIKAQMLSGFDHINFYLPSDIASGDTMLTVTWNAELTGATIGAAALGGVNLNVGDTVKLLTAESYFSGVDDGDLTNTIAGNTTFLAANSLATDTRYTLGLSAADKTITATVTAKTETTGDDEEESSGGGSSSGERGSSGSVAGNDRVKSPVETRIASLGILTGTADMLAGAGFDRASEAVQAAAAEAGGETVGEAGQEGIRTDAARAGNSFVPYAVMGGSSLRQNSGSHVDTKGLGISVGFSKEIKNTQGTLLVAPFVEYSHGKYDSYQDNGIHADGKSRAYGLGVMARQTRPDGLYYEGSLRFGRVKSDYSSQLSTVTHADYDSSSNYWAGHLGLGKITALKGADSLNCYLKYFYTHQAGDDVTVNINGGALADNMNFDSVDSHRLRIGARLTHKVNEQNSFYGGLAYQYEFSGDARATYRGQSAPSPSVKGGSGMLELGWQVKPGRSPVTIELGVIGWAGKQRGITGQLGFNWKF